MNLINEDDYGKKKRGPNFTSREKTKLLNIVFSFKNVIENKRTDAVIWRDKDNCWEKITSLFNCQTPEGIPRSKESLKKLYDNLKKNTRKEVAQEKKEIFKTGGGPEEVICRDPSTDLLLDIINPKTVFGLTNSFDSDLPSCSYSTEHDKVDVACLAERSTNNEAAIGESSKAVEEKTEVIAANSNSDKENVDGIKTPTNLLRKRISEPLEIKWTKRRRPNVQQLSSTQLSEEYLKVARVKQEYFENEKVILKRKEEREEELFQISKKNLENDREIAKRKAQREEELFLIQKQIMLVELQTKEIQLKNLKSDL